MYIRRKQNTSGSTSVYILEKQNGKQVLIKSMGSASTESSIVHLESLARKEVERLTGQRDLAFEYEQDEQHVDFIRESIQSVRIVGTELVLVKIYNEIGFNQIPDTLLRHLIISRLLYPGSKLRTVEYLSRHYQEHYAISSVYRYLDQLNQGHKQQLQLISYQHTLRLFDGVLSAVFYDVSTLYFEASREDELRKLGFSKDGKPHCPQIILGLLVSSGGYPLAYEMFEGNKYEGETLIPVLEHFNEKYNPGKLVVVADAGLLSKNNIEQLTNNRYEFILGARCKSETKELKCQILSKKWGNGITHEFEKEKLIKLIVGYSDKRAKKDIQNRNNGIKRLEKRIRSGKLTKDSINNRGYNKFLKIDGNATISLDLEKIKDDSKWDGLKGYITNSSLNPQMIIDQYKQLWHIEKAFRISKTDLKVRPVYHRKASRIESHLLIAFCSYKLYKELERQLYEKQTSLSPEKALDILKSIYGVKTILPASNKQVEIVMAKTKEQKDLLSAFNIKF
jgi:transposase